VAPRLLEESLELFQGEFDSPEGEKMANKPGPQLDVKYCPACKGNLKNVPCDEMTSSGYIKKDGTVSPDTHTYTCTKCGIKFEINQQR